jgi:hypothetical protein
MNELNAIMSGHGIRSTARPGADYRTQLMLRHTHERDGAEHLAGAGLHSPDGFTPPGCPRCEQPLHLVWRDTGGRPVRRLDCPTCGLRVRLTRTGNNGTVEGYTPDFRENRRAYLHGRRKTPNEPKLLCGLTEAQREALTRDFRAACTLQIRAAAIVRRTPAELAAELPPGLRRWRAMSMLQGQMRHGGAIGGGDVPCPACPEFKADDATSPRPAGLRSTSALARCGLCLGFKNVPRGVAEWWVETRSRETGPHVEENADER